MPGCVPGAVLPPACQATNMGRLAKVSCPSEIRWKQWKQSYANCHCGRAVGQGRRHRRTVAPICAWWFWAWVGWCDDDPGQLSEEKVAEG
ncbi:hypothetical protein K505DRAFT_51290 [Melanomma pulvis-pyrius CBS 109.77]|uniref:Uncharacterized protein n=1 Tax=Melanomma pulvis-pyrius CBS 109.77 TaxID=1314802 RepID=A0A6A6X8J9_9PLEO|nr:hypothetical protein K505DRAFT_51290 [Melanomma pulvis-pyrius CBS 109.77]